MHQFLEDRTSSIFNVNVLNFHCCVNLTSPNFHLLFIPVNASGMLRHFVWYVDTTISQELVDYILMVEMSIMKTKGADSTEIWSLYTETFDVTFKE
jgi:hypothetical protein